MRNIINRIRWWFLENWFRHHKCMEYFSVINEICCLWFTSEMYPLLKTKASFGCVWDGHQVKIQTNNSNAIWEDIVEHLRRFPMNRKLRWLERHETLQRRNYTKAAFGNKKRNFTLKTITTFKRIHFCGHTLIQTDHHLRNSIDRKMHIVQHCMMFMI